MSETVLPNRTSNCFAVPSSSGRVGRVLRGQAAPSPNSKYLISKCKFSPHASSSRHPNSFVSMPGYLEGALGAIEEVRERADYLSRTVSEAEQEVNYKLLQPVIEDTVRIVLLRCLTY
jgi:hypothetical protein